MFSDILGGLLTEYSVAGMRRQWVVNKVIGHSGSIRSAFGSPIVECGVVLLVSGCSRFDNPKAGDFEPLRSSNSPNTRER